MLRKLSMILACLILGTPVFAQDAEITYLVFPSGQVRTGDQWRGKPPVVGQNVAAGSIVVPWVVQKGDTYPWNYLLDASAGTVSYSPPAPPAPSNVAVPNVNAFETAVFNDSSIAIEARMALADKFPLIERFLNQAPVQMQMYWAGLKAQPSVYPWLTSDVITKVEAYASQYHIPLVAQ